MEERCLRPLDEEPWSTSGEKKEGTSLFFPEKETPNTMPRVTSNDDRSNELSKF